MAMATTATAIIAAFLLFLLSTRTRLVVAAEGCTDELISFSPCLSYTSDPPNNLTESPSDKCCDAFSSAVESASVLCLCYFVRYPNILGFPLNTTRLLSLSSICTPPPSPSSYAPATPPPPSLSFLCSASPALPPLNSSETLGITKPASASGSRGESGDGGGSSRGRMTPKSGENPSRSNQASSGSMAIDNFPVANGPLASSTSTPRFFHTTILLLHWILVIPVAVRLPLLNTVVTD